MVTTILCQGYILLAAFVDGPCRPLALATGHVVNFCCAGCMQRVMYTSVAHCGEGKALPEVD